MKFLRFLIFLIALFFASCKNKCEKMKIEIQSLMKDLYKKKINFPNEMELLNDTLNTNKNLSANRLNNSRNFTIVHFFTADCDKCINELLLIQKELEKIKDKSNVNFIFIASAPTKIYVLDAIKKTSFSYPIYYEKRYYSFKTLNNLSLSDNLYDTMLLNSKDEVILFGAFYDNTKAENLYLNAIECGL